MTIERTSTDTEKEGMFIGKYVINPVNGKKIPVWTVLKGRIRRKIP